MGFPFIKKPQAEMKFTTRAEAFAYMLSYQLEKNADPMEAARNANEFADIFATNMGIPLKTEPDPQGMDKYLCMVTKISDYIDAHPKVVEYAIPAVTFVAGLFTAKKVEQSENHPPIPPIREKIDFEQIPD